MVKQDCLKVNIVEAIELNDFFVINKAIEIFQVAIYIIKALEIHIIYCFKLLALSSSYYKVAFQYQKPLLQFTPCLLHPDTAQSRILLLLAMICLSTI